MPFNQELALADPGKELRDRSFDRIDLGLIGLGRVPALPVDIGEHAQFRAALAHPGNELGVRASARHAAIENEVDVAVAARPEHAIARPLDRAPGNEGTRAGGLDAVEVDKGRGVGERGDDAGLPRDLDQVTAPSGVAAVKRDQCPGRRLRPRPAVGLRLAHPHRHAAGLARERHRAARSHDLQIGPLPMAARTFASERGDGDDDEAWVILPQQGGIEPRR